MLKSIYAKYLEKNNGFEMGLYAYSQDELKDLYRAVCLPSCFWRLTAC